MFLPGQATLGTATGTINDVTAATAGKPTFAELGAQVGKNKIAISFVWVLITGYLVMFMQAGFALVETGFTRAKNAAHTMAMNMVVYGLGVLGFWVCGFALDVRWRRAIASLGGTAPLSHEVAMHFSASVSACWPIAGFS